jgi:NDP-sugar pyrophosphorylase family protein
MFTGIHILEPRVFDYIPRGVFSDSVTDVYPKAMANGETFAAHVGTGTWRELSTLKRYVDISVEMLKERGETYVAGADCDVARSAEISDSVLWDNVKINAGAQIRRSVLANDVQIPDGAVVENSVVVPRALVEGKTPPEKALSGHFEGENFIVPL